MSRIDAMFETVHGNGAALIAYATAGFPDPRVSLRIAAALLEHCDALELGIPFSDPVLDGPVIQESSRRALEAGFRVRDVFDMTGTLRERSGKPLMLMTYYNHVHRMGHGAFAAAAADAGVDGVLVPDLPPEEGEAWMAAAERRDGAMLYRASVADNFSEPWLVAHPGWAEASIPRYEKLDFDAVLNLCRAFLGIDWTAELHRITAPALEPTDSAPSSAPTSISRSQPRRATPSHAG